MGRFPVEYFEEYIQDNAFTEQNLINFPHIGLTDDGGACTSVRIEHEFSPSPQTHL